MLRLLTIITNFKQATKIVSLIIRENISFAKIKAAKRFLLANKKRSYLLNKVINFTTAKLTM